MRTVPGPFVHTHTFNGNRLTKTVNGTRTQLGDDPISQKMIQAGYDAYYNK